MPDKKALCPIDKVNRQFRVPAPNMVWVSGFTYVASWKVFVYVDYVIDAYARRIVGQPSALRPMQVSSSTPSSRRRMNAARQREWDWSTTATAAASFCPSRTPGASQKKASSLRSAASLTVMTTHWPRPSTACSGPTGNIPPTEAWAKFYTSLETEPMAAQQAKISLRQTRCGSDRRNISRERTRS